LIALVGATLVLGAYAQLGLDHTLPTPLYSFVHAQDSAGFSTAQGISVVAMLASFVLMIAGLIGLWWNQRWARWTFTISALAWPVVSMWVSTLVPAMLVANAFESAATDSSLMAIGATLAMIWFSLETEFARKAVPGGRGVLTSTR
jgi:hypothetical protein